MHLYGQMADMDRIVPLAEAYGLVSSRTPPRRSAPNTAGGRAGAIGHYGCLSFFPSKNLGAAGDAGMVVTSDATRADQLRCVRAHGSQPKYHHRVIGGNFRLDALQAAIVSVKLRYLDEWTRARQRNAHRYDRLFREAGAPAGARSDRRLPVSPPRVVTDRHIFNQYVIRVPQRDRLKAALQARGITTEVYYPVPMHLQECFTYLDYPEGALPVSEAAAAETLALPVYPELTDAQAGYVVDAIREFFDTAATARPLAA